jgi:hypothetical protein
MYIQDEQLRSEVKKLLAFKTRNSIVKKIQDKGNKFHFFQLTNFLEGKDVSLSTLKKIDNYIKKNVGADLIVCAFLLQTTYC